MYNIESNNWYRISKQMPKSRERNKKSALEWCNMHVLKHNI